MNELTEKEQLKEQLKEAVEKFQKCPFYHWWNGSFVELTFSKPDDDNEVRDLRAHLRDYLQWPFFALFDRIGL